MKIASHFLYPVYKLMFSNKSDLFLNFGSGKTKIPGFINIDGNLLSKPDILYDIRNELPFSDSSVRLIYTAHMLEHFYIDEVKSILKEFHRVIKPEGIVRIIVPDLEASARSYILRDASFFSDFPERFLSFGGKFFNFIFCSGQHKITFDFEFMSELLNQVGFKSIYKVSKGNSRLDQFLHLDLKNFEQHYEKSSLFVEVIK